MEPPPPTAQVTSTPATGLPSASVTRTTSESGSADPTAAVWLSPLTTTSCAPAPETAVALKLTLRVAGTPVPVTFAVTRCCPAAGPRVQVAEAWPFGPVVALPGVTCPPPASIVKLTA